MKSDSRSKLLEADHACAARLAFFCADVRIMGDDRHVKRFCHRRDDPADATQTDDAENLAVEVATLYLVPALPVAGLELSIEKYHALG